MEQFAAPSIQQMAFDAVALALDHGVLGYRIPAALASLLLLLVSLFGPGAKHQDAAAPSRRSDFFYLLVLATFLLALRWPVLALGDLEGDESVAVSAALTRYLDPAFGVRLFTGSAGPLLTYPVAAVGLFGIRIDYGAAKLISLLLTMGSSALLYLALRTLGEARTARVAMLPLLFFLGMSNTGWTLSYCSEQWINLLVISMIYCLLRLGQRIGREGANLCAIGLALGLIPLVKWQGMPMAALAAAWAAVIVARRRLREGAGLGRLAAGLLPLAVLGLAPILAWCVILWSVGSLGFFYQTYFSGLFTQATSRFSTTMVQRMMALPEWGITPYPMARLFLAMTVLFWVPAVILLCFVRRPRRPSLDLALAALYLVVSVYAVLQPGGGFAHYMNLLLLPYCLLLMLVCCRLAEAAARPALVLVAYLGLTVFLPSIAYLRDVPLPVRFPPTAVRAMSLDALRALRVPGSPMIQWGWVYAYYVLTGMTWGTRTGGGHEILEPFFPDKTVFVADFVENLESGRAPVFLDTALEGAPSYPNRELYGHERVPEIADAVRRNYFRCAEFPGARLYLHRQRYLARAAIRSWCAGLPDWNPPPPP